MNVLHYPEYGRLCMAHLPAPAPAPDSVVIKVAACGICGSEIETFRKRSPRRQPPLVMGHEFCGTVVEAGKDALRFKSGDKVISHSIVHCGVCAMCRGQRPNLCSARQVFGMDRPGAFAEYVAVPERALIPWPAGLGAAAASLTEPLANGVHIANLTRHLPVASVLVIGAGPIGVMCQLALMATRNANIFATDINPIRRSTARKLGARVPPHATPDNVIAWMLDETDGQGVDLVIDAVGSSATRLQSIACARPGGAAVWIGLHEDSLMFSTYNVILREKQIIGTYAATLEELQVAANLLTSQQVKVDLLVTPYALNDGVRAFEDACEAKNIKSVLLPQ